MEVVGIIVGFCINQLVEFSKKKFPEVPTKVVLALLTVVSILIMAIVQVVRPELDFSLIGLGGITFSSAVGIYEYFTKQLGK